jgi:outer membrane receptor protein involved in Fe transport
MKRILLASTSIAFGLMTPFAAAAQTAEPQADGIEDILVTAQRRDESAQDVGVALTVLSGEELARRGVTNVNQLQFQTPSLEVVPAFGGGQPQFRLRGVGFEDYATNNTPTVGIYVDEVAYPVPAATQGALFDVERVEVLRGPQGTLYGRNTTGGAINFITRKPTAEFSAGIDAEYGSFDLFKVEGFVSAPIGDTLRVRVSGITEQGGAFQTNRATGESLGDADRLFGRAVVEWTPASNLSVTFNVHGGRDQSEQTGLYLFAPFTTVNYPARNADGSLVDPNFLPGPTIPADTNRRNTGWGLSPTFAALAGYGVNDKPNRDNSTIGGSVTAAIDLGDTVRLTSISAYDHLDRRELADWDASASNESDVFWGSDVDVYSQELRLSSLGDTRLGWVGGVYYSRQTLNERFLTDFSQSLGIITDTSYSQEAESISGFGQLNFKLTDTFSLIGGLRYEHEDRKLRNFRTAIGGAPTFTDGNRDAALDEVSGKFGFEVRPTDALLLYANFSRGVKSGGFTVYNSPKSNQIDGFRPEILYAYEGGFKADFGRAVRINGSVFYYDYRDQQVLGTVIDPDRGQIGRIINAPKTEIYGGEIEIQLVPARGFRISQSLGYKFGSYKSFRDIDQPSVHQGPDGKYTGLTIDKSGLPLPIAQWSYQGSVSYAQPIGDYEIEGQADYSFRDELPSFLGPVYDLPERWIANATLTLRPQDGRWSIGAYGRNLFGTDYDLTRNFFLPNARIASPGRPASYGLRLSYSL